MTNQITHDPKIELQERIKELTCLYEVVRLSAERYDASLSELFNSIVKILPPAWRFPDAAQARIVFDSIEYKTPKYVGRGARQVANIFVRDLLRGTVEIVYEDEQPSADEGPFLQEERALINAIAAEISGVIERRRVRDEKDLLENQIRHADRLATIGQLAAGVAHELNDPLSNILGFAQLALKTERLPKAAGLDLDKIVKACLHARDIVSKLRLFARQIPVKHEDTNLNNIVEEGLYFTEAQCAKQQITIIKKLDPNLPSIIADSGQMHQVLTNLTVNAVQAMPEGGKLSIETYREYNWVLLKITDTGGGISNEIMGKIFLPFFTTKPIDQGTGLGLSVVEGIVTTHHGTISVSGKPGESTTFEIRLPINQEQ